MTNYISSKGIMIYKILLSPFFMLLGSNCRFEESCSYYMKRSIDEKGILKGTLLGIIRILKCQPFYTGDLTRKDSYASA